VWQTRANSFWSIEKTELRFHCGWLNTMFKLKKVMSAAKFDRPLRKMTDWCEYWQTNERLCESVCGRIYSVCKYSFHSPARTRSQLRRWNANNLRARKLRHYDCRAAVNYTIITCAVPSQSECSALCDTCMKASCNDAHRTIVVPNWFLPENNARRPLWMQVSAWLQPTDGR